MSDITPAGVVIGFWRWFWVGVLALVLIAGIVIGGWQANWWFASHNINRQTQLIQNSDSNQRALVSDITAKIATVEQITVQMDGASGQQLADLHAQRLGVAGLACNDAAQLSSADVLGDGIPAWIRANCLAGTVNPASALEK
jgi:hypothetical protein